MIPNPNHQPSADEFWDFCVAHPDSRFELTAQGQIVAVPWSGGETSYRMCEAIRQLGKWSIANNQGKGFDSSVSFSLSDGAVLSPDVSWVANERLAPLSKKQRRKYLPVCPNFIIEVMSPSDRLRAAKTRMENWIANGVQLGWLIDADRQTVYIYCPGRPAEKKIGATKVTGDGPVEGFVLELASIWEGL